MPENAQFVVARDRIWELHLRGFPKARIAREVGVDPQTVTRHIKACYVETGRDLKAERTRKLDAAILRMRRVQVQAWDYCDADDARERAVLEAAVPGTRYQSQRAQYLRVILDAEKEINRLEGLYEALGDETGVVMFKFVVEDTSTESGGVSGTTARLAPPEVSGAREAGRSGHSGNDPDEDEEGVVER